MQRRLNPRGWIIGRALQVFWALMFVYVAILATRDTLKTGKLSRGVIPAILCLAFAFYIENYLRRIEKKLRNKGSD